MFISTALTTKSPTHNSTSPFARLETFLQVMKDLCPSGDQEGRPRWGPRQDQVPFVIHVGFTSPDRLHWIFPVPLRSRVLATFLKLLPAKKLISSKSDCGHFGCFSSDQHQPYTSSGAFLSPQILYSLVPL